MNLTPEVLAGLAGGLMSLAFSYIPGLSDGFAALTSTQKSGIMALVIVAVAGAAFGLSCTSIIQAIACTQDGLVRLAQILFVTLTANQAVYKLSPQRK